MAAIAQKSAQKQWCGLDICKFALALLLVCAHYASEIGEFPTAVDTCFSLYIIACPFFFMCSSFLFFSKYAKEGDLRKRSARLKKFCIRIMGMYAAWSAIYFCFVLADWGINGTDLAAVLTYFHKCLVYTTYSTIWFLPALTVGVVMTVFLRNCVSKKALIVIAVVFYIAGTLGKSYAFLLPYLGPINDLYNAYNGIFLTTRNGVFNAFPFAVLGFVLATSDSMPSRKRSVIYFFLFLIAVVMESLVLKKIFHNSDENTVIFLLPCTYYLMCSLLQIEMEVKPIYKMMRQNSTLVFLTQRLFLSAIPAICPAFLAAISFNPWAGLTLVLVATLLTSLIIRRFADKFPVLGILC